MMKHTRFYGILLLLAILVMLVSSCASNKPPYRHYKPRQKKCDCSRWSYVPGNLYQYHFNEEGPAGRA